MSSRKIILKSSEHEEFEVDEVVALESETIKHLIEDNCANNPVPLPNVSTTILLKVIEYCKKHKSDSGEEEEIKNWDKEFVKLDQAVLFDLILAANYLDIKGLLDLTCQAVADIIKDKSVEEVRSIFNIENDYSPEEEAEVRRQNQWAFE
ncbi:hypothetical protein GIB67_038495 [Kingdonia uniflora]|uniref:SKP1-like protein n=1 Tax=Kingdonia uniflora TaxID=39325 RepID=A0A7J7NPZ7_9MAGN|nr:hypothetical protein GIB67_038495 [Kingdonia uniflora]